MELVIARFQEDLSWIAEVPPEVKIFVVNMGDGGVHIPRHDARTCKTLDIGHESFAYVTHILQYYDHLDDHTMFLQGNPFDHAASNAPGEDPNFIGRLKQILAMKPMPDYIPIGKFVSCDAGERMPKCTWRMPCTHYIAYDYERYEGPPEIYRPVHPCRRVWNYLMRGDALIPETLRYQWGNQFMASRSLIRKFHPEFYRKIMKILNHDPKPFEASVIERIWPEIWRTKL